MRLKQYVAPALIAALLFFIPAAGMGEDVNIIYKHDKSGVADEVIRMKEFDYNLLQRERERIERENLEDSMEALKVGDIYLKNGEIDDAITYYQIAIKMDPSNTAAHEKYIQARTKEKAESSSRYHRAMEYYRKGLTEKAIDELVAEIKAHPDNEKARIKLNEIER